MTSALSSVRRAHTSPESEQGLLSVQRQPRSCGLGSVWSQAGFFQLPVCSAELKWLLGDHDVIMLYSCPFPSEFSGYREGKATVAPVSSQFALFPTSARASPWFKSLLPGSGGSGQDSRPTAGRWVQSLVLLGKILYAVLCGKENQTKQKVKSSLTLQMCPDPTCAIRGWAAGFLDALRPPRWGCLGLHCRGLWVDAGRLLQAVVKNCQLSKQDLFISAQRKAFDLLRKHKRRILA